MLFHSYQFVIFFCVVTVGYFMLPPRTRVWWLLIASYFFYGSWKIPYLALILVSTAVDYTVARALESTERRSRRRALLACSLAANLGLLFTFKYFNFFAGSVAAVLHAAGMDYLAPHLDVLLPVGISFYTFQTLSYTIDVYRGTTAVERHAGRFGLFVAFFPQLVAGPIERASRLLPQLNQRHAFAYDRARSGALLALWGFFKKVVIADRLAVIVDFVFGQTERCPSWLLTLGVVAFAFQIYCDFSGYTDIARGCARILGIQLVDNFDRPYFATSIADFWRRWHLSLTTWFRDYVYLPLGGNRVSRGRWVRNILVVFLVSGLWHGANWTFVIWGAIHAVFYLAGRVIIAIVPGVPSDRSGAAKIFRWALTFIIVCIAWIFFRADSLSDALSYLRHVVLGWDRTGFETAEQLVRSMDLSPRAFALSLGLIPLLWAVEWRLGERRFDTVVGDAPLAVRWLVYVSLTYAVLNLGPLGEIPFVYYQF